MQPKVNANRASRSGEDAPSFFYAERHSIASPEINALFLSMSQDGMIRPWILPDQWRYPQDKVVIPASRGVLQTPAGRSRRRRPTWI
jgi:hypothetical protein